MPSTVPPLLPAPPLLETRGITKRYGQVEALRGADFTVYPGEVVALLGDNGAGKSTLVKAVTPYDLSGECASGIGSPHTPGRRVWPISLCVQALTAPLSAPQGRAEAWALLDTLAATTAGTFLMHESFDPDHPATYSRPWFAWANSLLAETVLTLLAHSDGDRETVLIGAAHEETL